MADAPPRSPVLSLTVVDGRTMEDGVVTPASSVLAVDRSVAANPTHPHVVSVPTLRIPPSLHDAIVASATLAGTRDGGHTAYFSGGEVDSEAHNGHAAVVYAVEALLARKLGAAELLESGGLRYRAALRSRVDDTAVYDNLGPENVYEPISMTNVLVELADAHALPGWTSSYSMIGWMAVAQFIRAVDTRDVTAMGPMFDPIELCVHGVCLAAARETLQHVAGRPAFSPALDPEPGTLTLRPRSLPGAAVRAEHNR